MSIQNPKPNIQNPSILDREAGLQRQLTPRQLSMIALGGAIGTGLFLGSAVSVRLAGPGVIPSCAAGAVIALLLAWARACRGLPSFRCAILWGRGSRSRQSAVLSCR